MTDKKSFTDRYPALSGAISGAGGVALIMILTVFAIPPFQWLFRLWDAFWRGL